MMSGGAFAAPTPIPPMPMGNVPSPLDDEEDRDVEEEIVSNAALLRLY